MGDLVLAYSSIPASKFLERIVILDDGKSLNFTEYQLYKNIIDAPPLQEIVMYTGRQIGKTIFVATRLIQYAFIPSFRMTYIAPTDRQVKDFSRMKLGRMLSSAVLREFLLSTKSPFIPEGISMSSDMILNDVYSKVFATTAALKLGFASDAYGVDRIRGGSADLLALDEAQNIDIQNVLPVVSPLLTSSDYGFVMFAGTPLNENDPLSVRFEYTTQHTMVIKCEACNRYNTVDSLNMVTPKGLVCLHCGAVISARKGRFIPMNPGAKTLGLHFNRLMLPMTCESPYRLERLIKEIEDPNQDHDKLVQEIVGRPSGKASRLITEADIYAQGILENYVPTTDFQRVLDAWKTQKTLVYSIDWGGGAEPLGRLVEQGGKSHTAVTLWNMIMEKDRIRMKLLYHKVFPLEHPRASLKEIQNNLAIIPPRTIVTADALGGTFANDLIREQLQASSKHLKFVPIQLGETAEMFKMAPSDDRIVVSRSSLLTKFFRKVAPKKEIMFPRGTELLREIANHYLAEVEFENELGKRLWRKKAGGVDDLLFASFFAWIAYAFFYNKSELDS